MGQALKRGVFGLDEAAEEAARQEVEVVTEEDVENALKEGIDKHNFLDVLQKTINDNEYSIASNGTIQLEFDVGPEYFELALKSMNKKRQLTAESVGLVIACMNAFCHPLGWHFLFNEKNTGMLTAWRRSDEQAAMNALKQQGEQDEIAVHREHKSVQILPPVRKASQSSSFSRNDSGIKLERTSTTKLRTNMLKTERAKQKDSWNAVLSGTTSKEDLAVMASAYALSPLSMRPYLQKGS